MPLSIDLCASSAIKKSGLREVSNQAVVELAFFLWGEKKIYNTDWLNFRTCIRLISFSKCERTIDDNTSRLRIV